MEGEKARSGQKEIADQSEVHLSQDWSNHAAIGGRGLVCRLAAPPRCCLFCWTRSAAWRCCPRGRTLR